MVTCLSDEKNSDDLLNELFGEAISSYTDEQAVEDGTLVPFVAGGKDTGHRITGNAYGELKRYYSGRGHESYGDAEFYRFFFAELLPLVPAARLKYRQGGILTTNYDFSASHGKHERVLWYIPNEKGGITIMKPEDY
jgi:hypothetical protein